jgi:hypothetical protein
MDVAAKQAFIRRKAQENRTDPEGVVIRWIRHAIAELANERWGRKAAELGTS